MNKEIPMLYADQMQFIVAAMTKDYDKARGIASTILKAEPGNTILRNYLPILEKAKNQLKLIHGDVDVGESDSEPADSGDSNSDNTDSNSNSDNSSDSDNDDCSQNTEDNKKERNFIEPKKFTPKFNAKELLFDNGKAKGSHDTIYKRNREINENKFRYNYELKGKIIRVLPIRLSEKINGIK